MMDAVCLSSLFGPYLHMNNSNSHIRDKEIIKGLLLLFYPSCNNIIKHFIYHTHFQSILVLPARGTKLPLFKLTVTLKQSKGPNFLN